MNVFYRDRFVLPPPAGHRCPMAKYARLRQHVAAVGACRAALDDAVAVDPAGGTHRPLAARATQAANHASPPKA